MEEPKDSQGILAEVSRLLALSKKLGALKFGEFTLTSGKSSSYYFDGRVITLNPEGSCCVARAILGLIEGKEIEAVAGPAVAGVPIVAAVAAMSYINGQSVQGLVVRKETKGHGAGRLIEGRVRTGARVAVVDDTCSTGGSILSAIKALEGVGCQVVMAICILDRQMGGGVEIEKRGHKFVSLLKASEEGIIEVSLK